MIGSVKTTGCAIAFIGLLGLPELSHAQNRELEVACNGPLTFFTVKPAAEMDIAGLYIRIADDAATIAGSEPINGRYPLSRVDDAEYIFDKADADGWQIHGRINRFTGNVEINRTRKEPFEFHWSFKGNCQQSKRLF